jgi:hypothetical protein
MRRVVMDREQLVKFVEEHPLGFVGLTLGAGILVALGFVVMDAGWKELFRWLGGWEA